MNDYNPIELTIDKIDRRYEKWKTTRNRGMERKQAQFKQMLENIRKREEEREKSHKKLMKKEQAAQREKLYQIKTKRERAKEKRDMELERLNDKSFDSYREHIRELRKKEREAARSK